MRTRTFRFAFPAAMLALFVAAGAAAQEGSAPLPADGATEGIAVHGHWTISVVRDGEVVERREFENALTNDGTTHLSELLARNSSPGNWVILLSAVVATPLCAGDTTNGACTISEGDNELTVSSVPAGSETQLVLEGSDTAATDGDINAVTTLQAICGSDTTPAACTFEGLRTSFTATNLDPTIAVQSGDRIDVTVEISFS